MKYLKASNKMSVSILHFSFAFRWKKALDQSNVEIDCRILAVFACLIPNVSIIKKRDGYVKI